MFLLYISKVMPFQYEIQKFYLSKEKKGKINLKKYNYQLKIKFFLKGKDGIY